MLTASSFDCRPTQLELSWLGGRSASLATLIWADSGLMSFEIDAVARKIATIATIATIAAMFSIDAEN